MKKTKNILLTAGALTAATLGISRYAYNIAFKAPKRRNFRDYILPTEDQYVPHHSTMKRCMDRLIEIPYEEITLTSFDGLKLFGRYYDATSEKNTPDTSVHNSGVCQTSSIPVHILFHGYKSNPYMDGCGGSGLVAELGHRFIVVDQRSHGQSEGDTITLKAIADFTNMKDTAKFLYKKGWGFQKIGTDHKMYFKLDHFTGYRFGLFMYSTKESGGQAGFSNFVYKER